MNARIINCFRLKNPPFLPYYRRLRLRKGEYLMIIHAQGKNIPTYTFCDLLIQGESAADTVTFVLDRFYDGIDMSDCDFCMRGQNEDGYEIEQTITPISGENTITLNWVIGSGFTNCAGKLLLELRANRDEELILKYNMQPVNVKPCVSGVNTPLPDTAEQAVSQINSAVADGLAELEEAMESFDLDTVRYRLDQMDRGIAEMLARPEVIPVTAEDYEQIAHKQNSLYVIIKEAQS